MRIFLASVIFLSVLGQCERCDADQKESIPRLDVKWATYLPKMPFPFQARLSRIAMQGVYVLDIDARDGHVIRTSVATGAGAKTVDDAARQALMTCRFKPGCPPRVKVAIRWQGWAW